MLPTLAEQTAHQTLDAGQVLAPYMAVFFVAFLVSFLTTPLMRILAIRNGVVDLPDFKRKAHLQPVAYLGGVALFLGWLAGMSLCNYLPPHEPKMLDLGFTNLPFPYAIVIGATVITLTGVIDDVYGVSPRVKIGGQLFAAAALATHDVGTRIMLELFGAAKLNFPYMQETAYLLGALLIAMFVLGGCNSLNLIDGMDGLASGVTAIAVLGFLFISIVVAIGVSNPLAEPPGMDIVSSPMRIIICLAMLGAILGFLPYNFNPANIFMGDAGSLLLGYLSVSVILLLAHAPGNGVALVMAALIVFALPIIDTTLAIVRRKMAGKPIFSPDTQHLHHQIRRAGLTTKQTVGVLYALAFVFAVIGCSMVFLRWRYSLALFMVMFCFIAVTAYKSAQNKLLAGTLETGNGDQTNTNDAAAPQVTEDPKAKPRHSVEADAHPDIVSPRR